MKTLGLDLGTNSIGWAIREDELPENQIEKFGVITFNKGVGEKKNVEYSLAGSRTSKRSLRRRYQAHKYKLWSTLEALINNDYCPLTIEGLNEWRNYTKGIGRNYPINDLKFNSWIKLDFDNDGKSDYSSPYALRDELITTILDFTIQENRFKLGRAIYHIAQHRAFKSSKKAQDKDDSEFNGDEDYIGAEKKKEERFNKILIDLGVTVKKTVGASFYDAEKKGIRIRENLHQHVVRKQLQKEVKLIFEFQGLSFEKIFIKEVNKSSIFWQRPLRSQKGTIGRCTLEPTKFRSPVSHPSFEEFRAWSFLNNIQFRFRSDNAYSWTQISLELRQEIYNKLFFRISKPDFDFFEIADFIKKYNQHDNWELNYKSKTNVSASPVCARLNDIFGKEWKDFSFAGNKTRLSKKGNEHITTYDINDIWHVLFSFDDDESVKEFAEKIELNETQTKKFLALWYKMPVSYGMLSLNAINRINRFLLQGFIYTEAVLLAKMPDILGEEWNENEQLVISAVKNIIQENRSEKKLLTIVNNLISKYKALDHKDKFVYLDLEYKLSESDINNIFSSCVEAFGSKTWSEFSESEQNKQLAFITEKYQSFFADSDRTYKETPHLLKSIKQFLEVKFDLPENQLRKIYHPSQIDIYPRPKEKYYEKYNKFLTLLSNPHTGSFKNPMAMKALFELRKLINYLLLTSQIDEQTRIVVEVARQLNDSNMRWAIETYQKRRQEENKEFANAIISLLQENPSSKANPENDSDINKFRLFLEQIENDQLNEGKTELAKQEWQNSKSQVYKDVSSAKEMVDKFRLWKDQSCICIYTGRTINITDLFSENSTDFEHTIPRSLSFDNSLANLTICDFSYNRTVKKNRIPSELPNYENNVSINGKEYTAIKPRIEQWQKKIEDLRNNIEFWKKKSKQASDKDFKDKAIRQKHLWKFELDYWQNKYHRFTMKEVTTGFKNSQLVDTQLISKFAFHYLRSVFNKVEVQKGSTTAEFRKIFGLQQVDEKKDRNFHSHHAKDAIVLTLIPPSSKRDEVLKRAFEYNEKTFKQFTDLPYRSFKRRFVDEIDQVVLINNVSKDKALSPNRKAVTVRGKITYLKDKVGNNLLDEHGNPKIKWATGDSIRGQLHEESFIGAVKFATRNKLGKILKDSNGNIQYDDLRYVIREPFVFKVNSQSPGFKNIDELEKCIVNAHLFKVIKKQVEEIGSFKEAMNLGIWTLNKTGEKVNRIRHIRIFTSDKNPIHLKKQTQISDKTPIMLDSKEHKNQYYTRVGDGYIYLLYQQNTNGKTETDYTIINLFDASKINQFTIDNFFNELPQTKELKKKSLPLRGILRREQKVFFYKSDKEELKDLSKSDLIKRLYKIAFFEADGRIVLRYHLEARKDLELGRGEPSVDFSKPHSKLRLSKGQINMAIENLDFKILPDGEIHWCF